MKQPTENTNDILQNIVKTKPKSIFQTRRQRWLLISGVIVFSIIIFTIFNSRNKNDTGQYITENATIGNLVVTVSATGTLQPTTSVDVGSEQSGTLASVLVQENDYVKQGQLLAQLDTTKLNAAVTKSQAELTATKAAVAEAHAAVTEAQASLSRMRQVAKLSAGKVPAKIELETAVATLQKAIANEASAKASVAQAEASLKTDETNLSKAIIRSPVNGVVLSRKVEPGQSVVSAMTMPVLFTIAEDLTKMELDIKVDEADVSGVKIGQPATFTVAAWPGRTFPANIERVGLGSTITDNVVTYKTVLEVKNNDLALRPGMTATATIVTAQRENALLVPNAALRFTPPQINAAKRNRSLISSLLPHRPDQPKQRNNMSTSGSAQIWILTKNGPQVVPVKTGVTNGRLTEIISGDLKPGMAVITDYQDQNR